MNKSIYIGISLLLFVVTGCEKRQIKSIEKNLVQGNWRISYCILDGSDKTTEVKAAVFTFNSNGTVSLVDQTTVLGTWNVAKENDANNDGIFNDRHIEFSLNLPLPYTYLSDDWEVEEQSGTKLELKGDSESQEDYLTFEKM
jgi:hypothetical protein